MSYVAVGGIAVSFGTSLLGSSKAAKEAQKQRELMVNLKLTEIASNEKIAYEEIGAMNETERMKFIVESMGKYREVLQEQSTIRLRDTWIYVAGLGCGTGVIYGLFLMYSKSNSNANG